ncbi:MAG: UDP-glucuronate 4-epimerase [Actinomycetota bacterium]|nr:UDP-glucuronate 4-epimerase [Actinomycetota bacterium]
MTGVAGFVGSHLAERLVADGWSSVVGVDAFTPYYDRSVKSSNVSSLLSSGSPSFSLVEADLRSARLGPLVDGVDVVFHQAAQPGVRSSWSDGFDDYVSHNVLATQRLLEACVASGGVGRFVYASSSSVYGNAPRYPTSEDELPRPQSPYGVTKLAAEHLCSVYGANHGLSTVALRYFTVYGPRQRPDMAMHRLIEAALRGGSFPQYGDGSQVRDFTFVDDIVRGNVLAASADVAPGTVCNLAGGASTSMSEVVALVGSLVGQAPLLAPSGRALGDVERTGGSTERARSLLGWSPAVGLEEGLRRQVAWHVASSSSDDGEGEAGTG